MNIKRMIVGLLAVALTASVATGAKADRFEDHQSDWSATDDACFACHHLGSCELVRANC